MCLHLANANRSCFISNKAIKLVLHSKWDKLRVNHILFWAFIWLWLQVDCMVNGRKTYTAYASSSFFFIRGQWTTVCNAFMLNWIIITLLALSASRKATAVCFRFHSLPKFTNMFVYLNEKMWLMNLIRLSSTLNKTYTTLDVCFLKNGYLINDINS